MGNGRDDNCIGGDLTAAPKGLDKPLFSSGFGLPRTPPIIVISVDSLRNDHVGRRVAGASLTPNMDRLLARSVTFTRAYAHAPYTSASMSAMWTSSPMLSMVRGKRWLGFEASLVELLSLAGYRTVAVTDMPATWCVFLGFSEVDMTSPPQDAKKLTDRALDHASRADRHTPLMLWVHYFDPHAPYRAHEKYEKLGGDVRGRYAQEVAYTDHHLGRLIGGLSREGLLEQSLVIFLSDHGESLGEGGRVMHGWSLAEEAVRVPLAFQGPNLQAREVTSPVSLLDLAPTVIDLLGGAAPPLWRGRSLIGALQGAPLAPRPVHLQADYHGEQGPSLAVIQWPWKYSEAAPFGLPRVELLAGGEGAPNSSAAPVEQLRRLLGRHTDLSLNDRLIARRKRTLRAIRPGCAWKEKVGADPSANRSMAAGFKGGRITPCGESGTLGP